MPRASRSPSYPSISLPEAVVRLKSLYDNEGKNAADREVIALAIGYTSRNGASDAVIASMGHYGLLEYTNDRLLRISSIGLDIILGEYGESDRANAIRQAAMLPELFAELSSQYSDAKVSNRNLVSYLVKREFSPSAANKAAKSFLDTIEFLNQETQSLNSEGSNEITENELVPDAKTDKPLEKPKEQSEWILPVDEDLDVRLMFKGRLTSEQIQSLVDMLEVHKKRLDRREQSERKNVSVGDENKDHE